MLITRDLAFLRNNTYLFEGLQFTLNQGELLQICGANGSGKSTLLRILAGFIEPTRGTVQWNHVATDLHYIGHQNAIKSCLTVYENIKLICALLDADTGQLKPAIEKMGLVKKMHTQARFLSVGQLRRLALTRLLLKPAKLWILDEPTTALDLDAQQLFLSIVSEQLANKGSVVLATHQQLSFAGDVKTLWLGDNNG